MSVNKAKEFLKTLNEKGAGDAWTKKAAEAKTEEEKFALAADMAKEMGYDLTAEDVREALTGLGKGENDLVKLDDDAVEGVAGGWDAQPSEGQEHLMPCDKCGCPTTHRYTGVFKPGFWIFNQYQYQCKECGNFVWGWF